LKIYKQNSIIRGYFKNAELDLFSSLSETDFDILNAIYYITQNSLLYTLNNDQKYLIDFIESNDFNNFTKVSIFASDIKKVLKIKNKNYIQLIEKSLKKLYEFELYLKDFIDPITGKKIKYRKTRIVAEFDKIKHENNEIEFIININNLFLINIYRIKSNYTTISTLQTKSLKSKYAKRLYEYLLSVKYLNKSISMKLDTLNKLFGVNYTTISEHNKLLKRIYIQVNEKIPFKYDVFKKDKIISFQFV